MNATITKRPDEYDDAVRRAACERMAARLEDEYPDDFPVSGRAEIVADLCAALEHAGGADGYQIGRALDSCCHWEVDARMVEVLDEFYHDRGKCRDEAVKAWVVENQIAPKLALGTKVMLPSNRLVGPKGDDTRWECEIVKVDAELATYLMFCPAAGHVREGVGTHGVIFPFEDVEAQG